MHSITKVSQKVAQFLDQNNTIQKIDYSNKYQLGKKGKKKEINGLKNGNIKDNLTSVDIQEIVKIVGKVIEIYEGIV